jgi:hypothetical protein
MLRVYRLREGTGQRAPGRSWRQAYRPQEFLAASTRTSRYTIFVFMKNVTITLDEETAQWVRVQAAIQETSVSRATFCGSNASKTGATRAP